MRTEEVIRVDINVNELDYRYFVNVHTDLAVAQPVVMSDLTLDIFGIRLDEQEATSIPRWYHFPTRNIKEYCKIPKSGRN